MQSGHHFHLGKAVTCQNQVGNGSMDFPPLPYPSSLPYASGDLMPVHGVELQPSEVCPRNFIIFDQNDYRSQIMFHPAMAHKFAGSGMHIGASYIEETREREADNTMHGDAYYTGDSDDIDALLSSEEDEQEEYEEEEVSTARTYGNSRGTVNDSCSIYGKGLDNSCASSPESCNRGGNKSQRKQQKMKKMVRALKGIVPGGEHMSTTTVIDEAVKYLKTLKVEAQKLGVKSSKT